MAESCKLYYITDRAAFPGDERSRWSQLLGKIAEAARAGVDHIQLREKDLPARELESLAREAVNVLAQVRTKNRKLATALLINSRNDLALAVKADGVHVRGDDISPQEVKAIWAECGAGAPARVNSPRVPLIAVSCHSRAEVAQAAANGADMTVFSPVFEKGDVRPAGLDRLREACQEKIPVLALGGVTLENAHTCLEAGAAGIAAIRLFQENNIASVVKHLRG
jgi:thiamine-phosphate pyrophosphorylase